MPSMFTLKALGLNTMQNQLGAPEGSLTVAKNVTINRDDVVESRRGFKIYGNSFGSSSDRVKQLMQYKLRILRHFDSTLQFDSDGNGNFLSFNGSILETEAGLRIKYIEMNGNLYLTTSEGIKKLSAVSASSFTTAPDFIVNSGAIKAVDVSAQLNYDYGDQTSFLSQDSAVAYRVVWGYRDANSNLILGTPSQRIEVFNPLLTLLLKDYMHLLGALDNIGQLGSLISDQNYVDTLKLSTAASASDLRTNLISLTAKIDADLELANNYANLGLWNASTNTPHIADNTSNANDVYIVSVAGTQDLGNGSVTYNIGDIVIYDGHLFTVDTTKTYKDLWDARYTHLGNWNAGTNDPSLADGTGNAFDFYKVLGGGTQNLGSGSQTFVTGDFIYYTGTIWLKSPTPIIFLQDGIGFTGDLYRVSNAGTQNLGSGSTFWNVNDLVIYNGTTWGKAPLLMYIADWNANTNNPAIHDSLSQNGDFYTVSVAGTQDLGNGPITFNVNDRIIFSSKQWTVDNVTVITPAPLEIETATIDSGVATITFTSGNPSLYFTAGSNIILAGFNTDNSVITTNVLNGITQTISTVDSTSLTFNTTVAGDIDLQADATITSNVFSSIPQPLVQDLPATDAELVSLQDYILAIISALIAEPNAIISDAISAIYIDILTVTKASTVTLNITIPDGITSQYFFQIYRSAVFSAIGTQVLATDVVPNDELALVYEAFPTAAELLAHSVTVLDVVPDEFRGVNLYTNASTGEGILQANEVPPFAKDINVFKNSMFFANTHTRHHLDMSLLGVQNMINDFNNGITPTFTVATTTGFNTYTFIVGKDEIFTVGCVAGSFLNSSGTASYFDAFSGNDLRSYRFWYQIGTAVAPATGGHTLIPILATAADSATVIAEHTRDAFNQLNGDFTASNVTSTVTVECLLPGYTTDASSGTSGFTIMVTQQGQGEKASAKQILLSDSVSPGLAVQETAQSLVRVLNQNSSDVVYAFYTSGAQEVPGQITLEARNLSNGQFSIITNNSNTGLSFNPSASPTIQISSISTGSPSIMLVTTSTPHGLTNLDFVYISGSNSTPSIDGLQQITYVSPTTFRVNTTITIAGTTGGLILSSSALSSTNDDFANRIYYSKLQQPEAVPILNYFDVGARDRAILRIYPLRDSLFIFKEDGVYRISGEAIPFNLSLFDSSCILVAPDSVSSVNNVIYGWTRQGVSSVIETGVRNISRPIDIDVLPLSSSNFTSFKTATWGMGYESDKSYNVFTVKKISDTYAKIGYRYNILTNTWTTIDKDYLCGVINFNDDKMYVGPGDINDIEQERKSFTREDYSDREYDLILQANSVGKTFNSDSIVNVEADDVFVQEQTVTIYDFNMLLKKLDIDAGVPSSNYFSTLKANVGDNMRTDLVNLATKLDTDSLGFTDYASSIADISGMVTSISVGSTITLTSAGHGLITGRQVLISSSDSVPTINGQFEVTVTGVNTFTINPGFTVTTAGTTAIFSTQAQDFDDLLTCYNEIITQLNSDVIVASSNFQHITFNTIQEALVVGINRISKTITIAQVVPYIQGAFKIFKAIDCIVQYSPQTFGNDPISLKHIREAQVLFDSLGFTKGTISFATDLLPMFEDVDFISDGNGMFGFTPFGEGFFGGVSNAAPIRTYIPRNSQRCRYMVVKFNHSVAREKWILYGITLTGETQLSERAYK